MISPMRATCPTQLIFLDLILPEAPISISRTLLLCPMNMLLLLILWQLNEEGGWMDIRHSGKEMQTKFLI